jgi:hypothetical protein
MGLPLSSVAPHLSSDTVRTWDETACEWTHFKAEHPRLAGITTDRRKETFKDSLVKDLIKHRVITSRARILDGTQLTWWQNNGDKLRTDGTPVQGLRTYSGFTCKKCSVVGRSFEFMKSHIHTDGNSEGLKAKPTEISGGIIVQTFSERFRYFFPVLSDPLFLPSQIDCTPSEFSALQVLENEQARILQTVPETKTFDPELRTLAPIFRDGGIEPRLKQFDRRQLSSLLPEVPPVNSQKKSSLYTRLRNAIFKLFAEDLRLLQDDGIHMEIPHILTNGSQCVSY